MTSTKHTPGPWSLSDMRKFGVKHISVTAEDDEAGKFSVAMINDPGVFVDGLDLSANGRLIAAAPELLEAAQTAHLWLTIQWENANKRREKSRSNATAAAAQADADEINKVRKRLGAVITKARGES